MFLDTIKTWLLTLSAIFNPGMYDSEPPEIPPFEHQQAILVFSKTNESMYRHSDSIERGKRLLIEIGKENNWDVFVTENGAVFDHSDYEKFDVIVFLSTAGNILNTGQKSRIESQVEKGQGLLGIHAAAETEPHWHWYKKALGGTYAGHEPPQPGKLLLDNAHPSMSQFSTQWNLTDEWWLFNRTPGANITVLGQLDRSTGESGQNTLPIVWVNEVGKGRIFYTGLGHEVALFDTQEFKTHIESALRWTMDID